MMRRRRRRRSLKQGQQRHPTGRLLVSLFVEEFQTDWVSLSEGLCVCIVSQSVSVGVSSVRAQVAHVCVGEKVTGGDAAESLVDIHRCDLSRDPVLARFDESSS